MESSFFLGVRRILWICSLMGGLLPGAFAEDSIRSRLPKQTLANPDGRYDLPYLSQLIESERPAQPEALLRLLSPDLRGSYALMYDSRSLQGASLDRPRVLLFDPVRASLVLSFAGLGHERSDVVEVMAFDSSQKSFDFLRVDFRSGRAQLTRPQECAGCHRGKPIWDSYDQWPGAYGSRNDAIFLGRDQRSPEAQAFAGFELGRPQAPLYRSLMPLNSSRPNTTLGILLAQANYARAAQALHRRTDSPEFRPALLGALLRCDIENFRSVKNRGSRRAYSEQALKSRFSALKSYYERESEIREYWKDAPISVADEKIEESVRLRLPMLLAACDPNCHRSATANLEYLDALWPGLTHEFDLSFSRAFSDFDDGLGDLLEAAPLFISEFLSPAERAEIFPNGVDPVALRVDGTPKGVCDRVAGLSI